MLILRILVVLGMGMFRFRVLWCYGALGFDIVKLHIA